MNPEQQLIEHLNKIKPDLIKAWDLFIKINFLNNIDRIKNTLLALLLTVKV